MRRTHHLSTPISEAYAVFVLSCKAQRYSSKTLEYYESMLVPFLNWLQAQGVSQIDDVTSLHIRTHLVNKRTVYVGTEDEREASGHTIHGIASNIRAFFNFCIVEGWLTVSPMKGVKMPRKPKNVLSAYTTGEIERLVGATKDDREKMIVYILLETGVRASECIAIRSCDIKWETNSIDVIAGKGEKDRVVYFGAETGKLLMRYTRGMGDNQLLFTNFYTEERFTYNGFAQLLRRLGKTAHIPCTAHKFRRTFAINSLRNGMNIYVLARLMGHEDISILKPYLEILDIDLQKNQLAYSVVDSLKRESRR